MAALHGRRLLPTWSPRAWITSTLVVAVVLAALFALASVHYRDTVLSPNTCPTSTTVNALLGTKLDKVSGVQLSDLHSCHYAQGSDAQALWIDGASSAPVSVAGRGPCRDKAPLVVAGHQACSVSGSRDTTPGRPSLLVETTNVDWQFTTNLRSVSMHQLETLATNLLRSKQPLFFKPAFQRPVS